MLSELCHDSEEVFHLTSTNIVKKSPEKLDFEILKAWAKKDATFEELIHDFANNDKGLQIKIEFEGLDQTLRAFLLYISLPNVNNINLDLVQDCEHVDYILSKGYISKAKKDKNADGQKEVISYAREIVETLRNLSLNTDEVTIEQIWLWSFIKTYIAV